MINPEYFLTIKEKVSWPALLKKFGLWMNSNKRAGKNTLGVIICPFHREKHPSCAFFNDGKFHCFGCGGSGDIFDFVRYKLKLSHPAAIRFFNQKFNIPLPNGATLKTLDKPGHWSMQPSK